MVSMKLRDWIDIKKLNWKYLSDNQNAIDLLKENQDKINWHYLLLNENAIELLKQNQDKLDWEFISYYQKLSKAFIEKYFYKLNIENLLKNRKISKAFRKKIMLYSKIYIPVIYHYH
jgi:hypothetical protein